MRMVGLGLTLMLLTGLIGYAHDMCQMHKLGVKEMKICPLKILDDLSPEQKAKIEEINLSTQKSIIPIKSQIELKQIDLKKEMKVDVPNKDKILKLNQEIHELEWQIKKLHIEQKLKIHSILTPEQRDKLKMHRKKCIKKIEIEQEEKE